MHITDKTKTIHQIIGFAVDEVLHASARTNSLDNISVVMIAFEPLVQLIDSYIDWSLKIEYELFLKQWNLRYLKN